MNLQEITNKIKSITDYSPELAAYNEQIALLISDAFYALWTDRRWKFAIKTTFLDIYPDVVPLQPDGTTRTCVVASNSRRVSFSGTVHALDLPYIFEGQIFEVQDRDYKIVKVVSATEIRLDVPFRGATAAADTTWKMKHRFYDIPQDAIELLYLGHRDAPIASGSYAGKVGGLTARHDEMLNLQEDRTNNYSECYIPVGVTNIPPAETLIVTSVADANATIPNNTYLELCWCFEGEGGKCGPLSLPMIHRYVSEAVPAVPGAMRLDFRTFDSINVAAAAFNPLVDQIVNQFEGLKKRIFFNQNFNRTTGARLTGLPVWREITLGSTAVNPAMPGISTSEDPVRVQDEIGLYDLMSLDQVNPGNKRFIDYEGLHFRIRPYPRPSSSDQVYQFFAGVADTNPTGCMQVTGDRNRVSNCHLAGIGHANNDIAGAYSLYLNGVESMLIDGCIIGLNTIDAGTAANSEVLMASTVKNIIFN